MQWKLLKSNQSFLKESINLRWRLWWTQTARGQSGNPADDIRHAALAFAGKKKEKKIKIFNCNVGSNKKISTGITAIIKLAMVGVVASSKA